MFSIRPLTNKIKVKADVRRLKNVFGNLDANGDHILFSVPNNLESLDVLDGLEIFYGLKVLGDLKLLILKHLSQVV